MLFFRFGSRTDGRSGANRDAKSKNSCAPASTRPITTRARKTWTTATTYRSTWTSKAISARDSLCYSNAKRVISYLKLLPFVFFFQSSM